jgi:Bacterial Ig domain/G8 domain
MAKLRRNRDQTESLPSCRLWAAVILLVALAFPTTNVAETAALEPDLALFQPGDLCGAFTSDADVVLAEFVASSNPSKDGLDALSLHDGTEEMPQNPAVHPDNPAMAREHAAMLALVPLADVTHTAIADGGWFEVSTWQAGAIPTAGARILIPSGVAVTYDGQSDVPLKTLRVDGTLRFDPHQNSRIVIDTLVVSPVGRLEIGTAAVPVDPDLLVEVLIAGEGDIDVALDPMLLSRGVVSHGAVEIHGARKTAFLKVGDVPVRGDRDMVLETAPEGWRVGDRLVLTGTVKQGWAWDNVAKIVRHYPSQDEVVTITAIDGAKISFDPPLRFTHAVPRADLAAYVANTTRNILFASLEGEATPIARRGHVMFMHNDAVDVRYAAFDHLGRTDKSREAFDVTALPEVTATSNIKGRYSLHLHKTGLTDLTKPVMIVGNSISDSPGWGLVHHSANSAFVDNVAFDIFGAAYAAEDGDETGIWLRNIAIRAQGYSPGDYSAKTGVERHDNGRTGDGFFFAGRLVEAAENIAANTTHGFVWMHRSAPSSPAAVTIHQPVIAYGMLNIEPDDPPIQGFRDNEAFGTEIGIIVIKANSEQGHDVRSVLKGFLNWETKRAVDISYTGHYTLLDFDLKATVGEEYFAPAEGVRFGTNAFDIVMNNTRMEGFPVGVILEEGHTYAIDEADIGFALIDLMTRDVGEDIRSLSDARYRRLISADLSEGDVETVQMTPTITKDEDLRLWADKRDSIGATHRQKPGDVQTIYAERVPTLLQYTGYRTAADGTRIALVPDLVADRATGKLKMQSFIVTLDISESELASWGSANLGPYDPANLAPVAVDDLVATGADMPVRLDLAANDADPEGSAVTVAALTNPTHGEVITAPDKQLIYRPDPGFSGTDMFTYWATDGAGNYAPATVRVEVQAP